LYLTLGELEQAQFSETNFHTALSQTSNLRVGMKKKDFHMHAIYPVGFNFVSRKGQATQVPHCVICNLKWDTARLSAPSSS
jgi:hypothetical protein